LKIDLVFVVFSSADEINPTGDCLMVRAMIKNKLGGDFERNLELFSKLYAGITDSQ